jgi:hypothetical protein
MTLVVATMRHHANACPHAETTRPELRTMKARAQFIVVSIICDYVITEIRLKTMFSNAV